jgi:Patatin-like phospholipase
MMEKVRDDDRKVHFEQVLNDELDLLQGLREGGVAADCDSVYERAHASHLAGLAFSGGGIRSATFNLGVIQALSRYGLLARFDYLSTVSGGGYIGGWLSALLHRRAVTGGRVDQRAVEDFQSSLQPHPDDAGLKGDDRTVGFSPVEHMAVRYLRRYSNYLSPRLGLSGDMLAAVSLFLRNFTLMQLSLITLVASILLSAHFIAAGSVIFTHQVPALAAAVHNAGEFSGSGLPAWLRRFAGPLNAFWPLIAAALALFFAAWQAGRLMAERALRYDKSASAARAVNLGVILPCNLAAWWFSAALVTHPQQLVGDDNVIHQAVVWMLVTGLGYAGSWSLGFHSKRRVMKREHTVGRDSRAVADSGEVSDLALRLAALLSGALFGLLLFAAACHIRKVSSTGLIDLWYAVAFGPALFLSVLSFVGALHIGAVRRNFTEDDREWLARLGGFVLLYAVAWVLIFTLVLYATPFVHWLAGGGPAVLGTWAGGSALGAWLARGPSTAGTSTAGTVETSGWKEIATRIAPWLFLAGLAVLVTYGTQVALFELFLDEGCVRSPTADFSLAVTSHLWQLNELPVAGIICAWLGTGFLFWLVALRLDINLFSAHAMYCNRLARAYLGASCAGGRKPNPFTGFDPHDDLSFSGLDNQRPIHIVNTAINMTGGDDLAWQMRRAASFAFTPCWAGYETRSSQGVTLGAYRRTRHYAGGRPLATLMAISGAAASPNMGYHTSPAVAALMTAFNLRLGRWCGNPDPLETDSDVWKRESPRYAATPLIAELSGSANARANWVNLTDGGHFENLGVYELVRRRCRFIVVTDAGCDPLHQFEDLANLIRKCWTDFGVNVRFESLKPVYLLDKSRYCKSHYAIGCIQYNDGGPEGVMIYLKASMIDDEWPDIRQYADSHKDFPHETTADQFFDENQFEAYRHLGYKVIARMVKDLQKSLGCELKDAAIVDMVSGLFQFTTDKEEPPDC